MSNYQKHWVICLIFILALTACNEEKYTVAYLSENPSILEKELEFCMSVDTKSIDQIERCKIAVEAQDNIKSYLEVQQIDPERFGEQIIEMEMAGAQLKAALDSAEESIGTLKTQNKPVAELQAAQVQADQAKKAYIANQQKLKILLAVVGLSSPE